MCGVAWLVATATSATALVSGTGKVVFSRAEGQQAALYVVNVDGSELQQITFPGPGELDEQPSWSPDRTKVVFARQSGGTLSLWIVSLGDDATTQITTGNEDLEPAWSPDGTTIAFRSHRDRILGLFSVNPNGTGLTNLTVASTDDCNATGCSVDVNPAWSPDGQSIAFARSTPTGQHLMTIHRDGTGEALVTDDPSLMDDHPTWSPDGGTIAFDRTGFPNGGQISVFTTSAAGGTAVELTTTTFNDSHPSWSADGTVIAFQSYRDGLSQIYLMNADGSFQQRIGDLSHSDSDPALAGSAVLTVPSTAECNWPSGSSFTVGTAQVFCTFSAGDGATFDGWVASGVTPSADASPATMFSPVSAGPALVTASWHDSAGIHSQSFSYVVLPPGPPPGAVECTPAGPLAAGQEIQCSIPPTDSGVTVTGSSGLTPEPYVPTPAVSVYRATVDGSTTFVQLTFDWITAGVPVQRVMAWSVLPPASCDPGNGTPWTLGYRISCQFNGGPHATDVVWSGSANFFTVDAGPGSPVFQPTDLGPGSITVDWDAGGTPHSMSFQYDIVTPTSCEPAQSFFSDPAKIIVGTDVVCYFNAGTPGVTFAGWTISSGFTPAAEQGSQPVQQAIVYDQRFTSTAIGPGDLAARWTGPDGVERTIEFPFNVIAMPIPPQVQSFSPQSLVSSDNSQTVDVFGSGFADGAYADQTNVDEGSALAFCGSSRISDTQMRVFICASAPAGTLDLTFTNPGGDPSASVPFVILAAAPQSPVELRHVDQFGNIITGQRLDNLAVGSQEQFCLFEGSTGVAVNRPILKVNVQGGGGNDALGDETPTVLDMTFFTGTQGAASGATCASWVSSGAGEQDVWVVFDDGLQAFWNSENQSPLVVGWNHPQHMLIVAGIPGHPNVGFADFPPGDAANPFTVDVAASPGGQGTNLFVSFSIFGSHVLPDGTRYASGANFTMLSGLTWALVGNIPACASVAPTSGTTGPGMTFLTLFVNTTSCSAGTEVDLTITASEPIPVGSGSPASVQGFAQIHVVPQLGNVSPVTLSSATATDATVSVDVVGWVPGTTFSVTGDGAQLSNPTLLTLPNGHTQLSFVPFPSGSGPATPVSAGTVEIRTMNPGPVGGTSNTLVLFVTSQAAPVSSVDVGTSTDPATNATATGGSVSAATTAGTGTVAVATYGSDPGSCAKLRGCRLLRCLRVAGEHV